MTDLERIKKRAGPRRLATDVWDLIDEVERLRAIEAQARAAVQARRAAFDEFSGKLITVHGWNAMTAELEALAALLGMEAARD